MQVSPDCPLPSWINREDLTPKWLQSQRSITGAMLLCVLFWGTGFVTYKEALSFFDPLVAAFGRQAVGLLVYCIVFRKWLVDLTRFVEKKHWWNFLFVAACEPCLYFIFSSYGMKNTSAAMTGIIMSCVPIFTTIVAWIFVKERPGRNVWIGFAVVVIAISWLNLLSSPTTSAPNPVFGNILLICACLCTAGYVVGLKKFDLPYPMVFSGAVQSMAGSVFFFLLMMTPYCHLPTHFELGPTLCLIYTGAAVNFGVYFLFNGCIDKLSAAKLTAFVNLVPVVTIVTGMIFLGERLTFLQMVLCAVILLGVYWSQKERKAKDRAQTA